MKKIHMQKNIICLFLTLIALTFFTEQISSQCKTVFNYTGSDQTFTVPPGVMEIEVKLWGAGGGGNTGNNIVIGGAGGFVSGTMTVTPGEVYTVIVGQGGTVNSNSAHTYGGGGYCQEAAGGKGGGRSAIRLVSTELVTSGGGGGGAWPNAPGCGTRVSGVGGGLTGGNGTSPQGGGFGGSQIAGGAAHGNGTSGVMFLGGLGGLGGSGGGGGGGGGGYYGGGGGRGGIGGNPPSFCANEETSGGGGSSFVGGLATTSANNQGNQNNPPNTTDPDYSGSIARGGASGATTGGNGRVVISYTNPEICNNNIDDDCDGLVDCDDPDCSIEEICDNNLDDDCDGLVDEGCCVDASISLQKMTIPGCPDNMRMDLKIFNGDGVLPVGSPITFYEGNPFIGTDAAQLNTYMTTMDIPANAVQRIDDIDMGLCMNMGMTIYAIIGDDGTNGLPLDLNAGLNPSAYIDCDYSDNSASIEIPINCGRYINISND